MQSFDSIVLTLSLCAFLTKRNLRYLRYLQQEEYAPSRFIDWIKENRSFDKRGSLICLIIFFHYLYPEFGTLINLGIAFLLLLLSIKEDDPRKFGKKKLVLTTRAKAIFTLATSLSFAFVFLAFIFDAITDFKTLFVIVQSPPFMLILAVIFLSSKEKSVQSSLLKEAHDKFVKINPFSIGVTGSFGKTSVKNLLGEILSLSLGATFWPQKGVNTEMGITREIRERMNEYDKYAVIEMGAYHIGSIEKLCKLTPVNAALVTAVHFVHLERFGGVEEVYKAKSELPQSIPPDGILVVNGDNPGARRMATEHKKERTYIYGLEKNLGHLDTVMTDYKIQRDGTSFNISWDNQLYPGFTKMHGRGSLSNILGCFTMACALGAKPEVVLAIIRDISPVSNRLEVKDYKNFIQINDAYNSNPIGFQYALEVLRDLEGTRRILITPGMIELGDRREEENRKIAAMSAKICDLVLVVNEINKKSFIEGLEAGGMSQSQYKYFPTRDEALAYYQSIRSDGDILLLENDLPDLLEFEEKF